MKSKFITPQFLFVTITILFASISRILPHPPNFTPIGAMALFGGAYFTSKKSAFIIPLLAMFISDCLLQLISGIGIHDTIVYVYASFVLITFIGIHIRNNAKTSNIILASLISSVLFFAITNFGVWAATGFAFGIKGLLNTYLIAIPFYGNTVFGSFFVNTLIGDLFYCGILFGSLYLAKSKFPALRTA